jgi:hypothetical protein
VGGHLAELERAAATADPLRLLDVGQGKRFEAPRGIRLDPGELLHHSGVGRLSAILARSKLALEERSSFG